MRKVLFLTLSTVLVLGVIGCGRVELAKPGGMDPSGVMIRSRATIEVKLGTSQPASALGMAAVSATVPVTVTNAPSVRMIVDTSQFIPPPISNALLDFGSLKISDLFDNQLKVCGAAGNQQCGKALLRIYTIGQGGAGLFNSLDNYGAPILAGFIATGVLPVGLNASASAQLQSYTIPNAQHVLRLSDFSPVPDYRIQADFTNAGAGDYSTTLVLEYVLAS